MRRIDTATKAVDLFGAGKHGFKNGDPALAILATKLNAEFFNATQEELANLIELSGQTLNPADNTQLYQAVQLLGATLLSKSVAGGSNVTLTTSESRNAIILLTGVLTANINVTVPAVGRQWIIVNNTTGAFTVTVKTAAGSGVVVTQAAAVQLYCDGTNVAQVGGAGTPPKQIQSIAAAVAGSALTLTLNPTSLDFRASPLTSSMVNTRTVGSALSLVVPSGATLGTANTVAHRLALLAIDNAGTVELAVVNLAGGNNLDETTLINTTAISAAATAANVIYSTTARTGVPFRVVGFIDTTQATAGTWAAAPSTIQGAGGQALVALSSLGYGQTWQNVLGSRANGTTYTNTTGKPIVVSASIFSAGGPTANNINLVVNGVTAAYGTYYAGNASQGGAVSAIVPPGGTYSVTISAGSIPVWSELR